MNFKTKMFSALGLALAVAGAAAFAGDDMKAAKVGEKAPDFTAKDLNGKSHSLKDHAGKIVVLEWVNPGCPVCKGAHQDGRITSMVKELEGMDDVVFLAVNSTNNTTAEQNTEALKNYGIEYDVLLDNDGKIGKSFGAKTTPHIFVIDTTGVLRYQGALDDDKSGSKTKAKEPVTNYVLQAIKQIKAGETVTPETTAPYGCSVKYAKSGNAKTES